MINHIGAMGIFVQEIFATDCVSFIACSPTSWYAMKMHFTTLVLLYFRLRIGL